MRDDNPDFIEALGRGLEVIRSLGSVQRPLTLTELSTMTGLARPTVRRILITLETLGYVRSFGEVSAQFGLTPRVLELGTSYVQSHRLWEMVEPHLHSLVAEINESSSIAELDGADVVYVARVAVPKLVTLSVNIGTRFPAYATSLGKVLLSGLDDDAALAIRHDPGRSGIIPIWQPSDEEFIAELRQVRARGWAMTDQQLAPAIRSVAAPVRNGSGDVVAAINVNTHAVETNEERLLEEILPKVLQVASDISADFQAMEQLPLSYVQPNSG